MPANAAINTNNAAYPALAEMGIIRFHEISHYSLRQDGNDKDVLRVNYKRAKGSLLPYSRKYKFGRSMKAVIADGGTARMEHTYEISPFLLKAVAELDALVVLNQLDAGKAGNSDLKEYLLTELNQLTQLVDAARASGDLSSIVAKIDVVRKHVEAL